MATAQSIVDYAVSQIGIAENPLGSNKQKYGALLDTLPWYLYKDGSKTWIHKVNGFNWCTQFVDASFVTVLGIDDARKILYRPIYNNMGAVVKYAFNYFKGADRAYVREKHDPAPGDVIYFQNSEGLSHTGIVIEVTDTTVTTVEGNSGKNSCYVAKNSYKKTSSYIYGYGCPVYEEPAPAKYPDAPFQIDVLGERECGLRTGPYSSCQYMGEIKRGQYTVKEASGDYGRIDAWIYLDTDKINIKK